MGPRKGLNYRRRGARPMAFSDPGAECWISTPSRRFCRGPDGPPILTPAVPLH